jgi:hypothetical protein
MSHDRARAGAVSTLGDESYDFYPPMGCQIGHSSSRQNTRALPIELPPNHSRSASPAPMRRLALPCTRKPACVSPHAAKALVSASGPPTTVGDAGRQRFALRHAEAAA